MKRFLSALLLCAGLTSCRDYDLHSRLVNQGGLVPADQFARYGREQAEEMAIAREFGSASGGPTKQVEAAVGYARSLPDLADIQPDPLGHRLTLRFKSGWRTMVVPIDDGKGGAETEGLPASAGPRTAQ